ncbi:MAG: NAD(P)H-dependent oxidoreductase subunit E [Alphaproteobacteria bacterium]
MTQASPKPTAPTRHPGRGKGGRSQPKGRQVEPSALAEVAALLAGRQPRRDLLIEHLHALQDAHGHLSARHLRALAEWMRLPMAEVYEVATFYHNFDVVTDGEAPPATTIRVCDSLTCAMMGAEQLYQALKDDKDVRVVHGACMGRCDAAPVARIGHRFVERATPEAVRARVADAGDDPVPDHVGFDAYVADGGYGLLRACQAGEEEVDALLDRLDAGVLRGLGGAGFPTGRKWRFVRAEPGPRLMAVNADESEPGTFKDRHYLLSDPHRFLEGMLIGAWAVGAPTVYLYLRDEYPVVRRILETELVRLADLKLELPEIVMRRGAGAYICGEESAMLESLEGKRGLPRHKPPYPSQVGLFGRPTLINNVETLYWVRDVATDPAKFASEGRRGRKGLRSFSVSGRVRQPGVKLAPAGISARELIDEYCGGMAEGHAFKGYLPGGASGGVLPASMADLPLDFGTLEAHGALIGSAAVIVLSDQDDVCDAALNLMKFFADESCGQCTPCRAGCEKSVTLMQSGRWDRPLLEEVSRVMMDASICGLGQAAPNGLLTAFKYFPEDTKRRTG